jgi:hypothetical protein
MESKYNTHLYPFLELNDLIATLKGRPTKS